VEKNRNPKGLCSFPFFYDWNGEEPKRTKSGERWGKNGGRMISRCDTLLMKSKKQAEDYVAGYTDSIRKENPHHLPDINNNRMF